MSATFETRGLPAVQWAPFIISGVACLVMCISAAMVRRYKSAPWFLWSQMFVDVVFVTGLLSTADGPESAYFMLYFMSIVVAARLLPSLGVFFVAGIDVVAFLGLSVAGLLGFLGWDLSDGWLVYTQVLVRTFAMLLVGLLSLG
ncbi:MAG: hypothetical protein AAFV53_41070, partial [Myxococcota bacterium]